MAFALDTNVVSERRRPRPHGAVLAWLRDRSWAQLMHRRSDTLDEDAMIAAIAKVHQLTVVTRNVADFSGFGVPLFDPFTGEGC